MELARAVGNRWLVDSGLQPGERLVVDGFQRIKPGDKVAPQVVDLNTKKGPAAAAPAPAASAPPAAGQSVDITARPGASR